MDYTFLIKHVEQAQAELSKMMARHAATEARQAQLEHEIAKLTLDIAQVHEMIGEIPKDKSTANLTTNITEWGLTDAIRVIMKAADRPLSAIDVRDRLKSMGFNVKQYQNDMATVNLTLERMSKQGEIDGTVKPSGGKRLYIWSPIGSNPNWGDEDDDLSVETVSGDPGQLRMILTSQRPSGKEPPAWYKHMKELSNPTRKQERLAKEAAKSAQPKPTRRELREAKEAADAVEQLKMRKRIQEFEAKKK